MSSKQTASEVIRLEHICRSYPPSTHALQDVTLSLYAGHSVAITGQSGSGKSTLLGILGLLDQPTEGTYLFDGEDVARFSSTKRALLRRKSLGFIFQSFNLIDYLTVCENVMFPLDNSTLTMQEKNNLVDTQLERVGLLHRTMVKTSDLSGGERQRVAIARALACKPRVLLCDEPTGNLDTCNSDHILQLLLSSVTSDSLVIIVTHDSGIAKACDQHIVLRDGCIVGNDITQAVMVKNSEHTRLAAQLLTTGEGHNA
ncbi:ABC transporter, ATP-binding protein [Gardnerella vaginalis 1500E]|uniref:ABC transporter, ATP-binding protein n=1 Tax=Gardnerella vaginalis 1500E TaxID=698957 RepID=I4LY02_GARVA|nr:ABC transporter ATP-binding protein [Gardnerella vaginalis]EIK81842.1 ABC transporter, ATP-binding protein [Gardnerella vaginalis 1500E]